MWLYCHRDHRVEDRERDVVYNMTSGHAYEMRDSLARQVAISYPSRVCQIPDGQDPHSHKCPLGREVAREERQMRRQDVADTMIDQPPEDKVVLGRLSPQRRKLLRAARKRSRLARIQSQGIP